MAYEDGEFRWVFLSFESPGDGRPVQEWYDHLNDDHRDEVKDRLNFLQISQRIDWDEPYFDRLIGEGGIISEIRFDPIKDVTGKYYYRIYGFFDGDEAESYNFLHVVNKKVRNDRPGKNKARERLQEVLEERASLHEFSMDEESSSPPVGKGLVC
jgi:hypothetical protein